ncbi:Hypothetical protein A7982_10349 [Minicystis rosea]|nr:Hypothetical protein A7982_10349 [Minicystis rosea]
MTDEDAVSAEASHRGPRPNGTRAKAAAVLVAVFLLGGLAGGALGRMTAFRELNRMMEGPHARSRLEAMRRHLDLRDDQVPRLRAILDEADAERDKLMGQCEPGLEALHKRTDARIRELLDDEQKKRLDALGARRGHRRHGPWGGPPHGPPP